MEYGDFLQCVQEYAKKETGRGGVVSINHVIKNNGCELDGLVIMEEGKHISPTIYLNGFYKQYQNGRTVEDIVREILHIYNENKVYHKFISIIFTIQYHLIWNLHS